MHIPSNRSDTGKLGEGGGGDGLVAKEGEGGMAKVALNQGWLTRRPCCHDDDPVTSRDKPGFMGDPHSKNSHHRPTPSPDHRAAFIASSSFLPLVTSVARWTTDPVSPFSTPSIQSVQPQLTLFLPISCHSPLFLVFLFTAESRYLYLGVGKRIFFLSFFFLMSKLWLDTSVRYYNRVSNNTFFSSTESGEENFERLSIRPQCG